MDKDPLNVEQEPEDRRAKGWNRLRVKFPFRRQRSFGESSEQSSDGSDAVVSDFLYSTGQNVDGNHLLVPKIDVSAVNGHDYEPETFEKFTFTKPPRMIGLKVSFASATPEVIGVGGDTAIDPAIAISKKQQQQQAENLDSLSRLRKHDIRPVGRRALSDDYLPPTIPAPPLTSNSAPQLCLPQSRAPDSTFKPSTSPSRAPAQIASPGSSSKGLRKRPGVSSPGDLRLQMRADEGRAFLSAASSSPKAINRKPVGGSDSESSSRAPTPSPQQLSPPPSRGADSVVIQAPQYPQALVPSDSNISKSYHQSNFPEASSWRPPSSSSESSFYKTPDRTRQYPNSSNGSLGAYYEPDAPSLNPGSSGYARRLAPPTSNPQRREESPSQGRLSPLRVPGMSHSTSSLSIESLSKEDAIPRSHGNNGRPAPSRPIPQPRDESPSQRKPPPSHGTGTSSNGSSRSSEPLSRNDTICSESLDEFRISVTESATSLKWAEVHSLPWQNVHVYQHKKDDEGNPSINIIVFDSLSSLAGASLGHRKFKLDTRQSNTVTLLTNPSPTLGISISPNLTDPREIAKLYKVQSLLRTVETEQNYQLKSQRGAHAFQAAVTGYTVRFDGIARLFSISRRRTVIPIHKSQGTTDARVEIVQGKGATRLVAFFSDFELAECLHLELKSVDVFETSETKDGMFCVKLVDAKFTLPEPKGSERPAFVSLDAPEYPSEHDDITIGFQDETVRDDFAAALPAEVMGPKKFTLKRRT